MSISMAFKSLLGYINTTSHRNIPGQGVGCHARQKSPLILLRCPIVRDGYETWRSPCCSVHFAGLDGTLLRLPACGYPSLHLICNAWNRRSGFLSSLRYRTLVNPKGFSMIPARERRLNPAVSIIPASPLKSSVSLPARKTLTRIAFNLRRVHLSCPRCTPI